MATLLGFFYLFFISFCFDGNLMVLIRQDWFHWVFYTVFICVIPFLLSYIITWIEDRVHLTGKPKATAKVVIGRRSPRFNV